MAFQNLFNGSCRNISVRRKELPSVLNLEVGSLLIIQDGGFG